MSKNKGKLLIGYDVESGSDGLPDGLSKPGATKLFLESMVKLHSETGTSATIFVTGQTLEQNADAFRNIRDCQFLDFQQHTYSHKCLKPLMFIENDVPVIGTPGMTLDEIQQEISKTNQLIQDILGRTCIGITGPAGYFQGLCDRPDILKVLYDEGIRFTRTWGRTERGYFNFTKHGGEEWTEPFLLNGSGFPDILEFPFQGNDYNIRKEIGWDNKDTYRAWFKKQIDIASAEDKTWSYAIHDHSAIRDDLEMSLVRELVEYALQKELEIISYLTQYQQIKEKEI